MCDINDIADANEAIDIKNEIEKKIMKNMKDK